MKLGVAIPTYRRPKDLVRTVQALLAQLGPTNAIFVTDNDPDGSGQLALATAGLLQGQVHVAVNSCNIGGNANILRCIETCPLDYAWLLGDDDQVAPTAVSQILSDLERFENPLHINYCVESRKRYTDLASVTVKDYVLGINHLSNTWLISNWVFKVAEAKSVIKYAYNATHSNGPHIALALEMLRHHQGRGVQRAAVIITSQIGLSENVGWSILQFANTRGSLLDIELGSRERMHLKRCLYELMGVLPHCALALALRALKTGDRAEALERFDHIYLTNFRDAGLGRAYLEYTFLRALLHYPPLVVRVARWARGDKLVDHLMEFDHSERV